MTMMTDISQRDGQVLVASGCCSGSGRSFAVPMARRMASRYGPLMGSAAVFVLDMISGSSLAAFIAARCSIAEGFAQRRPTFHARA